MPVRIAFPLIRSNWRGGFNYLLNLFDFLCKFQAERVEPILLADPTALPEELSEYEQRGLSMLNSKLYTRPRLKRISLRNLLFGHDRGLAQDLTRHRMDVLFENALFFGRNFPIPTLAWFPDLQHQKLTQYFSRQEFWRREFCFRAQAKHNRHVMVSSHDAKDDTLLYYPTLSADRIHVVRFATPVMQRPSRDQIDATMKKYSIDGPYYFLPNRFWAHKNHLTVVEMLAMAKKKNKSITVIACGNPSDSRNPQHFDRLMTRVADLQLETQFRYIGQVPGDDLTPLAINSRALINPSLFEGWSTTVEEAKALGIPMILSDLDVHREQCGDGAAYFERESPEDLLRVIEEFDVSSEKDNALTDDLLRDRQSARIRQFAKDFTDAALAANSRR